MHVMKLCFLILFFAGAIQVFPQIDQYPTYLGYLGLMEQFQEKYPDLCKIEEFGTSVNGKKLLAAKISDNISELEQEPRFFLTSTLRGDELVGYVISLRLIDYLLSQHGIDEQVTRLVDNVEIWINPLANPDGTYNGGDNSINDARGGNANGIDLTFDFPIPEDTNSATQPETQTLVKLFADEHFVMSANLISGLDCAIYPWGYKVGPTADDDWFKYVARQYANTAQENSPSDYFQYGENGVDKQSSFYSPPGTFLDCVPYFHHCRSLILALSNQKMLPESQLEAYWEYNYRSLLNYIEQTLYGVRGVVTAYSNDMSLEAKVFIENHDKDSSFVWSHPLGDYYRPLHEGTYTITFSSRGYQTRTFSDVQVVNGQATILNVQLHDPSSISCNNKNNDDISFKNFNSGVYIVLNTCEKMDLALFTLQGKLVRELPVPAEEKPRTVTWSGMDNSGNAVPVGCYVARFIQGGNVITKGFVYTK